MDIIGNCRTPIQKKRTDSLLLLNRQTILTSRYPFLKHAELLGILTNDFADTI